MRNYGIWASFKTFLEKFEISTLLSKKTAKVT